ncbi:MAG: HEPN domain-containing protein, partial [Chlamydiota bacterium]
EETLVLLEQAKEHWKDTNWLLEGRRYSACLHSCHQTLEKLLKAAIVEFKDKIPPKGHQLESLARETSLKMPLEWHEELAEITRHFWRVRYPDMRRAVYTKREKVMPTYEKTREIYLWLLKKISK